MIDTMKQFETFSRSLKYYGISTERNEIDSLQLHLGRKMSQSCINNTSPDSKELPHNTIIRILDLLKQNSDIRNVHISIENSEFSQDVKFLIERLIELNIKIIFKYDRYHIEDESYINIAQFLAKHKVDIIASIPSNQLNNEDKDYFENDIYVTKTIDALKLFNELGYGIIGSELEMNLEYIPIGIKLPGEPDLLEAEYKRWLKEVHGIFFNNLIIKTNMPINQYAHKLMDKGEFTNYCNLLFSAFDCNRADKIDCKHQLTINWNGELFDCEHNLSIDIPVCSDKNTIWNINNFQEVTKEITFARHCYGCTARCGRH